MIDLSDYNLTDFEKEVLSSFLGSSRSNLDLRGLWSLMDAVWDECECSNQCPDEEKYARFYAHPVWLLNGLFIECHDESMAHRQAIVQAVNDFCPSTVVDVGGGFGTLARMIARVLPSALIHIYEPYPSRYGVETCKQFSSIRFVSHLERERHDVLLCTDVLEHVQDPLALLSEMISSVRVGGYLIIANCFYPVIKCHLPSTFHLRNTFNQFCNELGLEFLGPCVGSHAATYQRIRLIDPDWQRIRGLESRSQRSFAREQFTARYVTPWSARLHYAFNSPMHYCRRLLSLRGPIGR